MFGLWILDLYGLAWANWLLLIGLAGIGGAVPPIIERIRRRKIENALPSLLETLSDSIGAGQGFQQAVQGAVTTRDDLIAKLFAQALDESHASSFDSALSRFAVLTRSVQIQRVIHLLNTAIEQDADLKDILFRLSLDYERLNDLMNKRESEMLGRSILILMFICVGLPLLIAFIVGLFAPWSGGFQVTAINNMFAIFFCATSMLSAAVGGRMLGRMKDVLWTLPFWGFLAIYLYIVPYYLIGG